MSRQFRDQFAKAVRAVILAVVLCLGLPGGALLSQPVNPPGNVPLPPNQVETQKLIDQEIERIAEQEKSWWAWVAWIVTPIGVLAVVVLMHAIQVWSEHRKAMKDFQDDMERGKTRTR